MATDYELEREARIAANKAKIAELGINDSLAEMKAPTPAKAPRQKRSKPDVPLSPSDMRRSSRPRSEVNYAEDLRPLRAGGAPAEPKDYTERIAAVQLDEETAERLRLEAEARRAEKAKQAGEAKQQRGPIDSGKGVRVQGGRVYDSKFGVTCHWCRQKTLEDHVTCTNAMCGNGKRMPFSFCHKCLKNRHGEDAAAAEASGRWQCPCCRGSCGAGCVICCNCGPCRKKASLEPTHQVVKLARDAGFGNVHDYLVHLVTGETPDELVARKLAKPWGAWLKEASGGSDASEQTAGAANGGGAAGASEDEEAGGSDGAAPSSGRGRRAAAAALKRPGSAASGAAAAGAAQGELRADGNVAALKQQRAGEGKPPRAQPRKAAAVDAADAAAAAGGGSMTDFFRASKLGSCRKNGGGGGGAAAAKASASQQESCGTEGGGSQDDAKRARKLQRMQRLGLAPVAADAAAC